eukprot:963740-Pleurochrysis_carterae.AAC.1
MVADEERSAVEKRRAKVHSTLLEQCKEQGSVKRDVRQEARSESESGEGGGGSRAIAGAGKELGRASWMSYVNPNSKMNLTISLT